MKKTIHSLGLKISCRLRVEGLLLLFMAWSAVAYSQTISGAEYFFDTDPGPGNGIPISVSASNPVTFISTISIAGLVPGYHYLFIRTISSDGYWSLYEPRQFFIQQSIVKAEYFFDTDPGVGLGIPIPITSFFTNGTFSSDISTSGLLPGYHFLFIRTFDESSHWSVYEPQQLFIRQSIIQAEYFFDSDPGEGLGISIPVTPTLDQLDFTSTVPASSLAAGFHFLFVRTRNEKGKWSLFEPQEFYINTHIIAAEYFIDTDPGIGSGTPLAVSLPDDTVTITPSVATGVLAVGTHYLFIRTKDIQGKWSLFEPQSFEVDPALPIELLDFSASLTKENLVLLNWSTVIERNNDYFTVERSKEGNSYSELSKVKGSGNSMEIRNYSFIDDRPLWGMNYYRLKQTDYDGNFSYSKVKALRNSGTGKPYIYPIPATDKLFVNVSAMPQREEVALELYNLVGKKCIDIISQDVPIIEIHRNGLSNGTYILKIRIGNEVPVIQKVIFQ